MKTIFRIWAKEYSAIFRDSGCLLIFFGAILIYPFFYSLPYVNEVAKQIPVAVVDADQSGASRKIVRMISSSQLMHITHRESALESAQKLLETGKIGGIILIPDDFERRIHKKEQAVVPVYADATSFLTCKQVLTGAWQTIGTFSAGIEIRRMTATGVPADQAFIRQDPLRLVSIPLFNAAGGYASYVIPAVLVLMLQQTLLIGVGLLSGTRREKRLSYPESGAMLALGRGAAYFSIYMTHAVYLFIILFRLYHFPVRCHPAALFAFLTAYLAACIFMAQAVAVIFRTRESAMMLLLFSSLPMVFLSGFSWPSSAMPEWLSRAALMLPSTAGIDGFLRLTQMGASLKDVGDSWAILLGLTAFYGTLAAVLVKRHAQPKAIVRNP